MAALNPSGMYCAYLRKSRKDAELEALGQGDTLYRPAPPANAGSRVSGESCRDAAALSPSVSVPDTLARHARALAELADRLGIVIAQTYREVVSGDTIAERPQMRALLSAVSAGAWDGVLCMDADRLGRGDSIDQGVIMQTFFYSRTLIITPDKIYDPADESDSEFFEIKLFFARREYNMIKKRMQRGRIASVMAGSYLGTRAPYGYERTQLPGTRKWTLRPVPEKAEIVRSMFRWYADEPTGTNTIARRLNAMGLTTDLGHRWTPGGVRGLLTNPVYIGKVQWNQRVGRVRIVDGQRVKSRPRSEDPILVDGLHEPIVDAALFQRVQDLFATHAKRPNNANKPITNPLAGLIVCDQCGYRMTAKNTPNRRGDFICCQTQGCPTCSTYIFVVENALLETLSTAVESIELSAASRHTGRAATTPGDTSGSLGLVDAEAPPSLSAAQLPAEDPQTDARAAARAKVMEQLRTLEGQSGRLYDLLEQGVYTVAVYRQRREDLDARLAEARAALAALDAAPRPDRRVLLLPQLRTVLDGYRAAETPAEKNALLRSVVDHVTYHKTQRLYRNNNLTDHLTLTLHLRLPDTD